MRWTDFRKSVDDVIKQWEEEAPREVVMGWEAESLGSFRDYVYQRSREPRRKRINQLGEQAE